MTIIHMTVGSFDNRYVYALPVIKDTNYVFYRIDTGSELEFSTCNSAKLVIASKKWTPLKVQCPEPILIGFGIQLNESELILFGFGTAKAYKLNVDDVSAENIQQTHKLRPFAAKMSCPIN